MQIYLVANDIRSTHNVGAFFRTCDGLGIEKIFFSGYTPYPKLDDDTRLPHFADKITRQIHKTALGAETTVEFEHDSYSNILNNFKKQNVVLIGLEQAERSYTPEECRQIITDKFPDRSIALFIGNEIHGIKPELLSDMDLVMEIPMKGSKESLNVSVATAIALYELAKLT